MVNSPAANLRNIGVIGHGGTGKTTLVSAALYSSGAVNRLGRVDQGNALTDFDPEEIERQISIQSALARCTWKDSRITFLDTPGYSVFRSDTKACMRVADSATVVVDAVSGVEVMTEKVWEYVRTFRTPALFVINRLDRDNASFQRTLESCTDAFGREVVPVQLPIGEAESFSGIIDLIEMKAFRYQGDGNGKATVEEIPADFQADAQAAREVLVEMIAESDEQLMEEYFEKGDLEQEQMLTGLRNAVHKLRLFPLFCLSAVHNIGTDRLLDACHQYLPSPADRQQLVAGEGSETSWVTADPGAPFSALVFKTVADPFAGRISMMKVFTGKAAGDASMQNSRTGQAEKLANLSLTQGKQQDPTAEVVAGELCAVAKLKDTATGDTLRKKGNDILIEHVEFPKPVISFAIEPLSQSDEEKIGQATARLLEEDPTLHLERDAQTGELLLSGLGQLHVEVTVAKLAKRFGVNAKLNPPTVPYRETIRRPAEAEGRHKKQSGGRGQFAVAKVVLSPLPRGAGFEFEDKIFGGSISQSFRPAVEKGIVEAAGRGVIAGHPFVDFKATLVDGKEHAVDSSEIAFKIAGSLAFKAAAQDAAPVLLEPVMDLEITVPDESMGDVIGDLNSRRGRVQGMTPRKGRQIIQAQVPLSECLSYAIDLNSLTGGRGAYAMEFSHYDEVPPNVAQRVAEDSRQARAQET